MPCVGRSDVVDSDFGSFVFSELISLVEMKYGVDFTGENRLIGGEGVGAYYAG